MHHARKLYQLQIYSSLLQSNNNNEPIRRWFLTAEGLFKFFRKFVIDEYSFKAALEVEQYAILALPLQAPNHTTTYFLRNTTPVCRRANIGHNAYLII